MIVLEGPDGGGKSSLAQRISIRFGLTIAPRASDSIDGPVADLEQWTRNDMATWHYQPDTPHKHPSYKTPVWIYDRYPLISEPIYSVICRDGAPSKISAEFMAEVMDQFLEEALVIFCVPPLRRVKDVVDRVPQMDGVRNNIALLWRAYDSLTRSYKGKSVVYDYARLDREKQRQETLLSVAITDHIRERLS